MIYAVSIRLVDLQVRVVNSGLERRLRLMRVGGHANVRNTRTIP